MKASLILTLMTTQSLVVLGAPLYSGPVGNQNGATNAWDSVVGETESTTTTGSAVATESPMFRDAVTGANSVTGTQVQTSGTQQNTNNADVANAAAAIAASHDTDVYAAQATGGVQQPASLQSTTTATQQQQTSGDSDAAVLPSLSIQQCQTLFPNMFNGQQQQQQQQQQTTYSSYTYTSTPSYTYTTTSVPTSTSTPTSTGGATTTSSQCDTNAQSWVTLCNKCAANPSAQGCNYPDMNTKWCPLAKQKCGITTRRRQTLQTQANNEQMQLCAQLMAAQPSSYVVPASAIPTTTAAAVVSYPAIAGANSGLGMN